MGSQYSLYSNSQNDPISKRGRTTAESNAGLYTEGSTSTFLTFSIAEDDGDEVSHGDSSATIFQQEQQKLQEKIKKERRLKEEITLHKEKCGIKAGIDKPSEPMKIY